MSTATYFPRFAVGANSEVAARAVSSLIPAPAPANAMPAEKVSNEGARHMWVSEHTDESVHCVRR